MLIRRVGSSNANTDREPCLEAVVPPGLRTSSITLKSAVWVLSNIAQNVTTFPIEEFARVAGKKLVESICF